MQKVCVTCNKEFDDLDWYNRVCCSAECSRLQKSEYARRWRKSHLEKARASGRRYYKVHAEERLEWQGMWQDTLRGKASAVAVRHNRRTRLSGISMTADTVLDLKTEFLGFCPYCWDKITSGCVDHIVPVSRGGTNARMNLVWVCKNCNSQKGNMSLLEFRLAQEAR